VDATVRLNIRNQKEKVMKRIRLTVVRKQTKASCRSSMTPSRSAMIPRQSTSRKIFSSTALLLGILSLFSSRVAIAAPGWSGDVRVTGIYTLDEGRAIVKLSSFPNPNGCLTNADGDLFLNPTAQKTWFTMLLTAYTAKQTVNIYVFPSCTSVWAGTSYADIGHVRLR